MGGTLLHRGKPRDFGAGSSSTGGRWRRSSSRSTRIFCHHQGGVGVPFLGVTPCRDFFKSRSIGAPSTYSRPLTNCFVIRVQACPATLNSSARVIGSPQVQLEASWRHCVSPRRRLPVDHVVAGDLLLTGAHREPGRKPELTDLFDNRMVPPDGAAAPVAGRPAQVGRHVVWIRQGGGGAAFHGGMVATRRLLNGVRDWCHSRSTRSWPGGGRSADRKEESATAARGWLRVLACGGIQYHGPGISTFSAMFCPAAGAGA